MCSALAQGWKMYFRDTEKRKQLSLSFHDSEPLEPGDLGPLPPRQIENLRWEGGASWLLVHFCGYILRSVGALTPGLKEIEGAAT